MYDEQRDEQCGGIQNTQIEITETVVSSPKYNKASMYTACN